MKFGDLRSMIHRGELPPLFATLPEDQHRYVINIAGSKITARQERFRLAGWLVYAEDPLNYKACRAASEGSEGRLDGVLRWYAYDVASEAMRLYGNDDSRSLNAIEVSRKYVLGEVVEEKIKRAHHDARAATAAVRSDAAYVASYAVYSAASAAARASYDAYYASYDDYYVEAHSAYASYDAYYAASYANLEKWFRCYLMRWIEEGDWWEVPS